MRIILPFLAICFLCIGVSDAAVRSANSTVRKTNISQPSSTIRPDTSSTTSIRNTNSDSHQITSRQTTTVPRTINSRTTAQPKTQRTTVSRSATPQKRGNIARNATQSAIASRAATESKTFGSGYNSCRDAYFTCMDQFCATAEDTYRRCICSSRLSEIKTKQRALGDAADQIQTFKDLNIDVIPKTAAEVNAMLTASTGEYAASFAKDTSTSAQKLAGISSVLAKTKSKSLSTLGTLDIAGDINQIWATTDLANGVNIANLSGETLYNAVHSQCANLVADHCESKSTLNMVITAYGMYIENDCTVLANALDKNKTAANATIRETEREMTTARLENYNAHNSTSINDCVAKVRRDITADAACGADYVHCLDVSGLYLNRITGEPIYSANFYKLETMVSLSGDILTNHTNRLLVAELNRKRDAAEKSLSTCQDLADDVWDEFMRQAITEIYQGQQSRIRQVKNECLDVVNKCYDQQTASLRDFSNTKKQLLLGSQLELSEQLCRDKLDACSNLYGGGPSGMAELLATMQNITSQKIAQNCLATLKEYAQTLCSVPPSDTLHSYPYACRVYAPGEQKYATNWACQNYTISSNTIPSGTGGTKYTQTTQNTTNGSPARSANLSRGATQCPDTTRSHMCQTQIRYISCGPNRYLSNCDDNPDIYNNGLWPIGFNNKKIITLDAIESGSCNFCKECPSTGAQGNLVCDGDKSCPYQPDDNNTPNTGETNEEMPEGCSDYIGSLYQKIVRYALQVCMRPSEIETINTDENVTPISSSVLQDVNTTMDSIRTAMSNALQTDCERLGGYWVSTQYDDSDDEPSGKNIQPFPRFYEETSANKKWGYCAKYEAASDYYGDNIDSEKTQGM